MSNDPVTIEPDIYVLVIEHEDRGGASWYRASAVEGNLIEIVEALDAPPVTVSNYQPAPQEKEKP